MRDATNALSAMFEASLADADHRIRVEDLLSAAAAVCGEACIAAAGDFDLEHHAFTPGSPVFSDRVNGILCADASDWGSAATSVFGIIRGGALAQGYATDDFPPIDEPIRLFARRSPATVRRRGASCRSACPRTIGRSCSRSARRTTFAGRSVRSSRSSRSQRAEWPHTCAFALVVELARVREAIDHGVAVRLVLETVNGMAKTAPMTAKHLRDAAG